jgi:capsule polysaccharide export protein KpsE/RkpR
MAKSIAAGLFWFVVVVVVVCFGFFLDEKTKNG